MPKLLFGLYWKQYIWENTPTLLTCPPDYEQYLKSDSQTAILWVGTMEVECSALDTPPSRDEVTKELVKGIRAEQGKHQAEITQLEEKLQNLLSLTYTEEA